MIYTIYYTIGHKKLKSVVKANDLEQAKEIIRNKIEFVRVEINDDLDEVEKLANMMGIKF